MPLPQQHQQAVRLLGQAAVGNGQQLAQCRLNATRLLKRHVHSPHWPAVDSLTLTYYWRRCLWRQTIRTHHYILFISGSMGSSMENKTP